MQNILINLRFLRMVQLSGNGMTEERAAAELQPQAHVILHLGIRRNRMKTNRMYIIPPLKENIIIAVSLVVLAFLTRNIRSSISYQYSRPEFRLIFSVVTLICFSTFYVVYEDKLFLCLFFIPIRKMRLEKVTSVTYFAPHTVKQGKSTEGYASILLTMSPCPPFQGTGDDVPQFEREHLLHTIRIKLNARNAQDARTSLYICLSHYGKTMKG